MPEHRSGLSADHVGQQPILLGRGQAGQPLRQRGAGVRVRGPAVPGRLGVG